MGRVLTPVLVKEAAYAQASYVSGTAATFGSVGASAIYDALSGVEGHFYVIHGWQAYYHADSSTKGHLMLQLTCSSGICTALMFCGTGENGIVQLAQPIKFPTGSGVYRRTGINDVTSGDEVHTNIFYSLIRES